MGSIDWSNHKLTKFQKDIYFEDDKVKNRERLPLHQENMVTEKKELQEDMYETQNQEYTTI